MGDSRPIDGEPRPLLIREKRGHEREAMVRRERSDERRFGIKTGLHYFPLSPTL
jgi:hypothetical protein